MVQRSPSEELYSDLASRAISLKTGIPASHKSLFQPDEMTSKYYAVLYEKQKGHTVIPKRRPGDTTCRYCVQFHLSNRKVIDKNSDLALGKKLEGCFQSFIEEQLNSGGMNAMCQRADEHDFHMPDFKIVNKSNGQVLRYFEFKVIFRPFLMIAQYVNAEYECYSNSLTLDLENGKKLLEQRRRVENSIGLDKVVYVYWYDLPCIKGVFWMPSSQVYAIMDKQMPYERQVVLGDFNERGRKNSATRKLYLPLLEMFDLFSFIESLKESHL